ncbi:MAG: saccharopine dehydrogenase family protein [Waterburya sp.]
MATDCLEVACREKGEIFDMTAKVLLYGATGYVGQLIAQLAKRNALNLILAGRNQDSVTATANKLGLAFRVFDLNVSTNIERAIADVSVVLNCAGPFSFSSQPLVDACLKVGTHYTDIAGEVPEFQALVAQDAAAKAAGIMLLPGIGFGVVPTDCLAVYLKSQLPTANKLTLIYKTEGGVSQGTANTVLPNLHTRGVVREEGQLIPALAAEKSLRIDLGAGLVTAVTNPWRADLVTAYYSTKIPNIEVYTVFPFPLPMLMQTSRYLKWIFDSSLFQMGLKSLLKQLPPGPTAEARAKGKTWILGIVEDETGRQIKARLEGSEAYDLTALTAIAAIKRILQGQIKLGFQTPASVYGADFILEIPEVKRY